MNPDEYENLAAIEQRHWYYNGKRRAVKQWLERAGSIKSTDVLLDCGAGTGQFAKEMESRCRVLVLDDHEEALRILRNRFRPDQIISLAGDQVPLPRGSIEFVTALDVLEHVQDDGAVVAGFARLLKPGGLAVVTVPASMALWSDWDEALHHFRRYNRRQLAALFPDAEWEIVHVNYTNVIAYPVVWIVRKWRQLFPTKGSPGSDGRRRSEDRVPWGPLNSLLTWSFVTSATRRVPFPIGVSLILIARRR